MSRRYFEEEMRYLHEAGKLFAERHPEQARFLNIDSVSDRDPYVERLFEGFAFLTGRIRERLDDEMPEYTESLISLLYPHYLKPVPSLAMLAFKPRPGAVQGAAVLKRGTEVRSDPVGDQGTKCRFTTTQDVRLHPLRLRDVELAWQPGGQSSATLLFEAEGSAKIEDMDLKVLRLNLVADPTTASFMHLFFTQHVSKVVIGPGTTYGESVGKGAVTLHGQQWVQPGALDESESLFPHSNRTFSGLRLLQEYLVFRRKFWCIDLHGLDRFRPGDASEMKVQVFFKTPYPEERRFRADNLQLFCTPIINIFEHDAEPISVDHVVPEYRVIASVHEQMEVYEVQHGMGIEEKTGRRHEYLPFYQFQHGRERDKRYFTTSSRFGGTGRFETFVNLNSLDQDTSGLASETLSLDTYCTNATLPREKLHEGSIKTLAPGMPEIARPNNISQPTLILYPPIQRKREFFWKLISHWSLNYQTVASKEALQGLLELYDWTVGDANRRRIAGIRDVSWKAKEVVERGIVLRGAEVTVKVQEDHFADEGDVALFGLILSQFLSSYATINSFVHLNVETLLSGRTYRWQPKHGKQPLV